MSITIGKIVSRSKGGNQYGVLFYTEGNSQPHTLKFETDDQIQIGDYVLGQYYEDESFKHFVFHYNELFSPKDISHWLTVFSMDKENGKNPLFIDIISNNLEQIPGCFEPVEESIPLAVMILEWGCNHIDSLPYDLLLKSYKFLCYPNLQFKRKSLGLAIIVCVNFINKAWGKNWFSSEKDDLLKVHELDKLIPNDKNAVKESGIQEDDSMAVFYSRRINAIASHDTGCSLQVFLNQTPALLFACLGSDFESDPFFI